MLHRHSSGWEMKNWHSDELGKDEPIYDIFWLDRQLDTNGGRRAGLSCPRC
jgi:hypothetical protein